MHDTNYWGDEYLQADINDVMEKIAPSMKMENQYHSPGPKHIEFGLSLDLRIIQQKNGQCLIQMHI